MAYRLLAAIVCVTAIGCRDNSASSDSLGPSASDASILLALDCYNPMYQLDAEGRVLQLSLTWRHLPAPALAEIGKLTELVVLDLYAATVTDEGLAQLRNLEKLQKFGLGATGVTDQGLIHLEKLPSLQWLWLPKQNVTPEGVERLKLARPDMNIYLQ